MVPDDLRGVRYRLATEGDVVALAEMRWTWRAVEDGATAAVSRERFVGACAEFLAQGLRRASGPAGWPSWTARSCPT